MDEKAVKILLKKYPEVYRKKYPWWKNETEFEEAMVNAIKGLWDNQEILRKELDGILTAIAELQDAMDQKEPQKENNGLISLEELFGEDEDTQIDKLKRQVKEQGEKIELLEREISVLQNEKILLRFQKTLARAKITNDMSEIAARLENIYVCGCFPLQFFVRSKHPICPTNDK